MAGSESIEDELSDAWDGFAKGELRLTRCIECERLRWPARAICARCGSDDAETVIASGRGSVVSWTVTHRAFVQGVETPYTVVLARLAEQDDIFVPGFFDGPADGNGLAIGLTVEAQFVVGDGGTGRLAWQLTSPVQ